MENLKILRKRLLYQSQYRGMREMDWLLGGFAKKYIHKMGHEQLKQLEALLAFPDQDLYGLFFEKNPIPLQVADLLMKKIQDFMDHP